METESLERRLERLERQCRRWRWAGIIFAAIVGTPVLATVVAAHICAQGAVSEVLAAKGRSSDSPQPLAGAFRLRGVAPFAGLLIALAVGWVLCALPHRRPVAVDGEIWQELRRVAAGAPDGDPLRAIGYPAPDVQDTRLIDGSATIVENPIWKRFKKWQPCCPLSQASHR